jgi:hypothetical protein
MHYIGDSYAIPGETTNEYGLKLDAKLNKSIRRKRLRSYRQLLDNNIIDELYLTI